MRKVKFVIFFLFVISFSLTLFSQWQDNVIKKLPSNVDVYITYKDVKKGITDDYFHKENCRLIAGKQKTKMNSFLVSGWNLEPCLECFSELYTYMEWQLSLFEPIQSKGLQYSDSNIDIGFQIEKTKIGFYLQNNTDSGIKINWDDISFVLPTGKATRVIHNGIKLIDRDSPQAPTTIPPMVRIEDLFIPSENIKNVGFDWSEESLFPGEYAVYNGLEFSLYFPMEIKGAKKDYFFKFKINQIVH